MVIETYQLDQTVSDPSWFRAEHLRPIQDHQLDAGGGVVLETDVIHRVTTVDQGTMALNLYHIDGAHSDRDYIRSHHHYAPFPRRSRKQRILDLIAELRSL